MTDIYKCGVLNCGKDSNGRGTCIHRLLDECCPMCGAKLVEVVTTGFKFCSSHESVCDWECKLDET